MEWAAIVSPFVSEGPLNPSVSKAVLPPSERAVINPLALGYPCWAVVCLPTVSPTSKRQEGVGVRGQFNRSSVTVSTAEAWASFELK